MTQQSGDLRACDEVLLLHAGSLGDCVLAMAFAKSVVNTLSSTRLTVASRSSIAEWALRHGLIQAYRPIESLRLHNLHHPDLVLDPQVVAFLAGFDFVLSLLGDATDGAAEKLSRVCARSVVCLDPRLRADTLRLRRHIIEQWSSEFESAMPGARVRLDGMQRLHPQIILSLRQRLAARLGAGGKDRLVICHPGSGGLEKCCPLDALESVADQLLARPGIRMAWMVGPAELDRLGKAFTQRLQRRADVLFEEDPRSAADLACGADFYIGNDAGMTHVAALGARRVVALFGPTRPEQWRPLTERCCAMEFPARDLDVNLWARSVALLCD